MAAQLPDKILVNGPELDLYSNPLEHYWILKDIKRPRFLRVPNCQRGYVAHWEIKDNQFLLIAIGGFYQKWSLFGYREELYTLKTFMPECKGKPVKANWFSGKLRIPQGKMTMYEHHGYDSRFEQEAIITINKGQVIKMVTIDYTKQQMTVNTPQIEELTLGSFA